MALHNNTPATGKIYIENLVVTYNDQAYSVNNLYTNKSYIYFNAEDPNNLIDTNIRLSGDNYFFIIKNVNGNGIEMFCPETKLVFDNFDKEGIKDSVQELKDSSESQSQQLTTMNNNVESLSDELKQTQNFDSIKETLNTGIVNYNALLISLSTTLTNYLSDNQFTTYEKTDINDKLNTLNNKLIEVLAYEDALVDYYVESVESDVDTNTILQYRVTLETYSISLTTQLSSIINSSSETVNNNDIVPITSLITNMSTTLSEMKNACNDLIFLGAGATISDETLSSNIRIDDMLEKFTELQSSILGSMDDEKEEIQECFNKMQSTCNKIVDIVNTARKNNYKLTSAQLTSLKNYLASMETNINKIKAYYETYVNNTNLDTTTRQQLQEYYNDFIDKFNKFKNHIIDNISDLDLSKSDSSTFTLTLADHRESRSLLNAKLLSCINYIKNGSSNTALTQIRSELTKRIDELEQRINLLAIKEKEYDKKIKQLEEKTKDL